MLERRQKKIKPRYRVRLAKQHSRVTLEKKNPIFRLRGDAFWIVGLSEILDFAAHHSQPALPTLALYESCNLTYVKSIQLDKGI